MLEFPQPAITKSKTAEAGTNRKRVRRGKPNRINPSYNRVRLSGRAKANVISGSPVLAVARARMYGTSASRAGLLLRRPCRREKLMCRLSILLVSWEKEECHSFVVPSYGRQFRRRIGQRRPLLLSHEVLRTYRIIRPRTLAYCKTL